MKSSIALLKSGAGEIVLPDDPEEQSVLAQAIKGFEKHLKTKADDAKMEEVDKRLKMAMDDLSLRCKHDDLKRLELRTTKWVEQVDSNKASVKKLDKHKSEMMENIDKKANTPHVETPLS